VSRTIVRDSEVLLEDSGVLPRIGAGGVFEFKAEDHQRNYLPGNGGPADTIGAFS